MFSNMLNYNLELLELSTRQNISTRRESLRKHLQTLEKLKVITAIAEDYSDFVQAKMIFIEQAIPCVIHMENIIAEQMLKFLLVDGFNGRDSNKAEQEALINRITDTVKGKNLGTKQRKSNWQVNLTQNRDISNQPMTNNHTRKIINLFDYLIPLCVSDDNRKEQWVHSIKLWQELIEMDQQKDDFTDAEIEDFDIKRDEFFSAWIKFHKESGVGNHIHMIGADLLLFEDMEKSLSLWSARLGSAKFTNKDYLFFPNSMQRTQRQQQF